MFKKIFLIYNFIFSLFLLFINLVCLAQENKCLLKVGYEINPPLIYQDEENKRLLGIDIDVLEDISRLTDCSIKLINMPWRNIVESIKSGEILLASSATPTEDRFKYSNFTIPYRVETVKLYVRKDEKLRIKANNLKEFLEQTTLNIGYNDSYEYNKATHELMHDQKFKDRFESVINSALNFYKLRGNLIDGILMESLMADEIIKSHDWNNEFDSYDFAIGINDLSFMVSKKADPDECYLKLLNEAIIKLKNNPNSN